jgi:hypothetical protein
VLKYCHPFGQFSATVAMASPDPFPNDLHAANGRLKRASVRVKIEARGDYLSLRATLPPKPDSLRSIPHDQRISLGIVATPKGLELAEADAHRLRGELTREVFDWTNWGVEAANAVITSEWIDRWKRHLLELERYKVAPFPEKKWRKEEWHAGLSDLHMNVPMSYENCLQAMERKSRPRARSQAAQTLKKFAAFCGLTVDLREKAGIYSRAKIKRNTPSTQGVIDGYYKLPEGSPWRNFYAICAAYGLRPLEVFAGDFQWIELESKGRVLGYQVFEELPESRRPAGVLNPQRTKTGARLVPPLIDLFMDEFKIEEGMVLPSVRVTHGGQAARKFSDFEIEYTPYDLRHHYNFYGTTILGYSSEVMALFLGHKVTTNRIIYQRGLDSTWALRAFDGKQAKLPSP